ncbi:addiction module antidote protein [Luteimonas salinilitoris]|uniref:Addiction module antidote protein n=1 Tax=Luteimonas salinilitoris TaxID=3237697 RepID=A0ABV4HPE5_9GAMM
MQREFNVATASVICAIGEAISAGLAEYLKTDADITAYLDACFDEAPDDPAFLLHALGTVARARNMSRLARDSGLTHEGLYKALSSDGSPSFGT